MKLALFAAEIQAHLQEMYGTEVSPSLISSVTDAVSEEVKAWQARPLDPIYPIVYLDCIHVKVREGAVRVKAVYLAIGITMQGNKEVLGLWLAQTEGAKFWLQVGVSGILCKRGGHQISERRSPNSMVNRVSAAFQSWMGIDHFRLMLRSARKNSLSSASSLGNEPRFLVSLRRLMLTDSMALVV